jgi:phenylpropionate dioxygenase-like ring-hydroxylating dioxygenase large terminal subunit
MSYLRNTWYVAAWDHEVSNEKPLARKILDEALLLFRDSTGKPQAIGDRCPHRFAPLSKGCVKGNSIQCAYHGLEFDGSEQYSHAGQSQVISSGRAAQHRLDLDG